MPWVPRAPEEASKRNLFSFQRVKPTFVVGWHGQVGLAALFYKNLKIAPKSRGSTSGTIAPDVTAQSRQRRYIIVRPRLWRTASLGKGAEVMVCRCWRFFSYAFRPTKLGRRPSRAKRDYFFLLEYFSGARDAHPRTSPPLSSAPSTFWRVRLQLLSAPRCSGWGRDVSGESR